MYTVSDQGRRLDFEGKRLGSGSSFSDSKARWFEVEIYKTIGGNYVVAGVGRSRVVHAPSCGRIKKSDLKPSEGTRTHDDLMLMACETCRPVIGSAGLLKEDDRSWALATSEPEEIINRLRLRDPDGVWYVPITSTRALEAAASTDEGLKVALYNTLYAPRHID